MKKTAILVCSIALAITCTAYRSSDEESGSLSTTEPAATSAGTETELNGTVGGSSSHRTSEDKSNEDCFCTYGYEDEYVEALTEQEALKVGDTIRKDESVFFKCKYDGMALTWQNGLRLRGNVRMICNICKEWQRNDVPVCEKIEGSDALLFFRANFHIFPGGIAIVERGMENGVYCVNSWRYPEWDYGQRNTVSVLRYTVGNYYISYLIIQKEENELSGIYECYMNGDSGQRLGSTFLHLRAKDEESGSLSTTEPAATSAGTETELNGTGTETELNGIGTETELNGTGTETELNETGTETELNVTVGGSSSHHTSEDKSKEDCFCTYEYEDEYVEAVIKQKALKVGDTIRKGESVFFKCKYDGMALTWQNGLRLRDNARMICNICKEWQRNDVPVCRIYEESEALLFFRANFHIFPGGIAIVDRGMENGVYCVNSWRYPEWDYGQRKAVSVLKYTVGNYYISYLIIQKEENELSGIYECYMNGDRGQRLGSTFLHLQAKGAVM